LFQRRANLKKKLLAAPGTKRLIAHGTATRAVMQAMADGNKQRNNLRVPYWCDYGGWKPATQQATTRALLVRLCKYRYRAV
jgi:hypothetical protein